MGKIYIKFGVIGLVALTLSGCSDTSKKTESSSKQSNSEKLIKSSESKQKKIDSIARSESLEREKSAFEASVGFDELEQVADNVDVSSVDSINSPSVSSMPKNDYQQPKKKVGDINVSSASVAKSSSQSSSTAITTSSDTVNSPEQAIALAKAKFGDNNGDWSWTYLTPIDPEYYFVKAISKQQLAAGSMTGTAKSVIVYKNGTIQEN